MHYIVANDGKTGGGGIAIVVTPRAYGADLRPTRSGGGGWKGASEKERQRRGEKVKETERRLEKLQRADRKGIERRSLGRVVVRLSEKDRTRTVARLYGPRDSTLVRSRGRPFPDLIIAFSLPPR